MPETSRPEPVENQRLRLLFKQAQTTSAVAIVAAIACTFVFYQASPGAAPLLWLAGVILAAALRFRLYRRFFSADIRRPCERDWLRRYAWTGALIGVTWGAVAAIDLSGAGQHAQNIQTLTPAFVLMATITSYGVYFSQYMVLWAAIGLTTIATRLYASGADGAAEVVLFAIFLPVVAVTAKRYCESLLSSTRAKYRSEQLVRRLRTANASLSQQNTLLGQQRDLLEQEEALAQHVFRQLTLGGDHRLPGVHVWNQSMGSLSGDLTQTAYGPGGQVYVFLGDFTGHGLPAALGALPASSVFLAMAAKGLPIDMIATELNDKLHQLLPVGYFCCAVLLELAPDRGRVRIWNGGLPAVLIIRRGQPGYEKIASHGLPLGVVGADEFDGTAQDRVLYPGDLLYAYTDGLTEAQNIDGEMWGTRRLEAFLLRQDLPAPKLPSLIGAVLEHVKLAPASDDISVVEIDVQAALQTSADAA